MKPPDVDRLRSVLQHQGVPGPVPFIEHAVDTEVMEAVVGHGIPPDDLSDRASQRLRVDSLIAFYRQLGYDYVPIHINPKWPRHRARASDTAIFSRGVREWENSTTVMISDWKDFETYCWPDPDQFDYYPAEYLYQQLPEDMGAYVQGYGGILEWACSLMSYEGFCLAVYDQPDLIDALFAKITNIVVGLCRNLLDIGGAVAFTLGDDMGHNTGLMVSPEILRKYVFPGHRKMADMCHLRGLPYLLHSCGNLSSVMEDLVTTVGIDGKHSYQDVIEPVEHFHARWGKRISILGGLDMDLLARGTEEKVRARMRQLLQVLGNSGSWCAGTGNTVANYVPLENYLAMLDEGKRWNDQWR